jgi:hypothetical protein
MECAPHPPFLLLRHGPKIAFQQFEAPRWARNYRDCTVGIIWPGKNYVCVVNFVRKDLW